MSRKRDRRYRKEKKAEEQMAEEMKAAEDLPETQEAAEAQSEEAAVEPEQEEQNPLEKMLEEAKAKTAEYLAMAQRVQADFENFRRRNETVRADAYADGRKDALTALLPVLDNLERAVDAAAESPDEALKNGVEMVFRLMSEAYTKMEVTPIDRLGEKFDPNLENAILQGTPEEGEPGTVCQVLQKGYRMGDRVLRHAMVKVVVE